MCTEAEYAFNTRTRIVPLRLEDSYEPDGWLGPLVHTKLWYDFSTPEKFDHEWSKLHDKLKELKRPAGCDTCAKTVSRLFFQQYRPTTNSEQQKSELRCHKTYVQHCVLYDITPHTVV